MRGNVMIGGMPLAAGDGASSEHAGAFEFRAGSPAGALLKMTAGRRRRLTVHRLGSAVPPNAFF